MKIGATKLILLNFNTSLVNDLNDVSVTSLEAFLFVGQKKLLKFKLNDATGFDGLIERDGVQLNVGKIKLTEALSLRLIPGKMRMEAWLKKTVGGIPEVYDITVDVTQVEAAIR